jgi:hypothetical protein
MTKNQKIVTSSGFELSKEEFFDIIRTLNTEVSQGDVYDARIIANYVCLIIEKIMLHGNLNNLELKHKKILSHIKSSLLLFKDDEDEQLQG